MPSADAALPWCQFVLCSTVSMWRRSSSASEMAGDETGVGGWPGSCSGRSAARICGPCASSTARSITFFSSRTLPGQRSEEHTSELQSHSDLVCRLLLEKKKKKIKPTSTSKKKKKTKNKKYI